MPANPFPTEPVNPATVKAQMEGELTAAWGIAQKIVDPAQQRWVSLLITAARERMAAGPGDQPEEVRAFGRDMNKILFGAFQAGMNVTDIDEKIRSRKPHDLDHDKSVQLYGVMNAAIFRAKTGAYNLQYAPLS